MGLTNRLFQEKGNLSLKENEVGTNLINHDYHLTKASRVIALGKLTSTEIYSILILKVQSKPSYLYAATPSCPEHLHEVFSIQNLKWYPTF